MIDKEKICVSISEPDARRCMREAMNHSFVEIRLDSCNYTEDEIRSIFSLPPKMIATCRPGFHQDNDRRKILTNAIASGADYVDIEIDSFSIYGGELSSLAKAHSAKVIVSYHNEIFTPAYEELKQIARNMFKNGADIAKIACKAESGEDCARLMALYNLANEEGELSSEGREIISIGMGEMGKITRLAACYLGAPFTYASVVNGSETAPGQMSKAKIQELMEMIG